MSVIFTFPITDPNLLFKLSSSYNALTDLFYSSTSDSGATWTYSLPMLPDWVTNTTVIREMSIVSGAPATFTGTPIEREGGQVEMAVGS